jgi:predicted RNA binding protein YcfA (HicA-like mRNA interferase family)
MDKYSKLREQILAGASGGNIAFSDLCTLLKQLGFEERTRGRHHIFTRQDISEILNLQPKGAKAKRYQVKQVRGILVKYLSGENDVD